MGSPFANYSADELYERTMAAVSLWRDTENAKHWCRGS